MCPCTVKGMIIGVSLGLSLLSPLTAWSKGESPRLMLGPVYQEYSLILHEGTRREAVGPFWYSEEHREPLPRTDGEFRPEPGPVTEKITAFPPFFSIQERPQTDGLSWDFIYPAVTYDRFGQERFFQALQLLNFSGGRDADGVTWEKFSFFPIYFQRRASDPRQNYTAVWPIYGHVEKHFFRDKVDWFFWPLYVRTRKRDVVTENFLVPVFHVRHGPGLAGWQFWPLFGTETGTVSTRTNVSGFVETQPGHKSVFIFWPIFFHNNSMLGTTNPVRQLGVLPLFSYQLSPARDTRTYLWPVGLTLSEDRRQQYNQTDILWPLLSFGRGPSRQLNRFFPLFSRDEREDGHSLSLLWPLYQERRRVSTGVERSAVRVLLNMYCDETVRDTQTGRAASRTDLWPLFITRRDMEGRELFQMLALLEPWLPHNDGVRRNYSPLWSIWRSETDKRSGKQSCSLLWNLYRCERTPTTRKFSAMFGLVQHWSGPDGCGWRLFHLFGRGPTELSGPSARSVTNTPSALPGDCRAGQP